jgi:hypothetical protein
VIHDVACNERKREWQDVHLMFHRGMLASGVDARVALVMYAAVYHFGPRWPREVIQSIKATGTEDFAAIAAKVAGGNRKNEHPGEVVNVVRTRGMDNSTKLAVVQFKPRPSQLTPREFEALKRAIEQNNLSIEDVENFGGATGDGTRERLFPAPGSVTRSR